MRYSLPPRCLGSRTLGLWTKGEFYSKSTWIERERAWACHRFRMIGETAERARNRWREIPPRTVTLPLRSVARCSPQLQTPPSAIALARICDNFWTSDHRRASRYCRNRCCSGIGVSFAAARGLRGSRLGHQDGTEDEPAEGDGREIEEPARVAEPFDDKARGQVAQAGANADRQRDEALGQIVAAPGRR
jgi:hypothetical protein